MNGADIQRKIASVRSGIPLGGSNWADLKRAAK